MTLIPPAFDPPTVFFAVYGNGIGPAKDMTMPKFQIGDPVRSTINLNVRGVVHGIIVSPHSGVVLYYLTVKDSVTTKVRYVSLYEDELEAW